MYMGSVVFLQCGQKKIFLEFVVEKRPDCLSFAHKFYFFLCSSFGCEKDHKVWPFTGKAETLPSGRTEKQEPSYNSKLYGSGCREIARNATNLLINCKQTDLSHRLEF